ncbi:hypothetical protein KA082_03355 [Candidatus Woesebacteria bacterium]|nr:hypothetical protein [Candidatus Woesebacteria bacterium]
MNIYPSILTDSPDLARQQLLQAAELEHIECVQIDIIDGKFADNITITPADLPYLDFSHLECDIHLMTEEPMDYVFELSGLKSMIPVRAVLGQIERMSKQTFFLEEVQKQGWKPGLSLDIFTPLESIDEESWQFIEVIQLMSVEAGAQGQDFNQLVLEKIKELQQFLTSQKLEAEICIDGGINQKSITGVKRLGVDSIVVGSSLWESSQKQELLNVLQNV